MDRPASFSLWSHHVPFNLFFRLRIKLRGCSASEQYCAKLPLSDRQVHFAKIEGRKEEEARPDPLSILNANWVQAVSLSGNNVCSGKAKVKQSRQKCKQKFTRLQQAVRARLRLWKQQRQQVNQILLVPLSCIYHFVKMKVTFWKWQGIVSLWSTRPLPLTMWTDCAFKAFENVSSQMGKTYWWCAVHIEIL